MLSGVRRTVSLSIRSYRRFRSSQECKLIVNNETFSSASNHKPNMSVGQQYIANYISVRWKTKNTKRGQPEISDEEDSDKIEENINDKHSRLINVRLTSMRLDGLIKSALGIARNKVDVLFYESKIRHNGQKVLKKTAILQEGDEVDVIKSFSPSNTKFLIVSRIEVLKTTGEEDHIAVKVRRTKSLLIDNYEDSWTG